MAKSIKSQSAAAQKAARAAGVVWPTNWATVAASTQPGVVQGLSATFRGVAS